MELIADMWLFDMGLRDKVHQGVARILMRTQIVVYKRTGHLMQFGEDRIHDAILQQARRGRISRTPVSCMRCGVRALLTDWMASADLTEDGRRFMLEGSHNKARIDLEYLRPCLGEETAKEAMDLLATDITEESK